MPPALSRARLGTRVILGPYLESAVLHPTTTLGKSNDILKLTDVTLFSGQKCIGLNTSELYGPAAQARSGDPIRPVYYKGQVLLESPETQLSDDGIRIILEDLRKKTNPNARLPGSLSILIVGEKNMTIKYMLETERYGQYGLIMHTTDANLPVKSHPNHTTYRDFYVVSLSVGTYRKSRKYLNRWHFFRTIRDMIPKGDDDRQSRDMAWFLDRYNSQRELLMERRLIFHSGDVDIVDSRSADSVPGTLSQPHKLPHDSPLRVLSWFASHAKWLLCRDHIDRYINLGAWLDDWERLEQAIQVAREAGIPFGQDWTLDSDSDREPEEVLPKKPGKPRKGRQRPNLAKKSNEASSSKGVPSVVYDPEYSDISTEQEPDTSDDDADDAPVELLRLVPTWGIYAQHLDDDSCWHCRERGCSYVINLRCLLPEQRNDLPPVVQRHLDSPHEKWSYADKWVKAALARIVHNHWVDHLSQAGVEAYKISRLGRQTQWRFRWKQNTEDGIARTGSDLELDSALDRDSSPGF